MALTVLCVPDSLKSGCGRPAGRKLVSAEACCGLLGEASVYRASALESQTRSESKYALSAVLSTEGRVVGLCWAKLKPKGPKDAYDLLPDLELADCHPRPSPAADQGQP